MFKKLISLGVFLFSVSSFANIDMSGIVLCKNTNKRPPDNAFAKMDIFWDHKSDSGLVVGEYVIYKDGIKYTGKSGYYANLKIRGKHLALNFKTEKALPPIAIDGDGLFSLDWNGQRFECVAAWDI